MSRQQMTVLRIDSRLYRLKRYLTTKYLLYFMVFECCTLPTIVPFIPHIKCICQSVALCKLTNKTFPIWCNVNFKSVFIAINNQLTLNCTNRYQHSHQSWLHPWFLAFLTLPRLLTLPSIPYLRYPGYLTLPFLVSHTKPYRTLSYPIILLPTIYTLFLPHPILAETTHQRKPNKSAPKIRPNDPDRNDPGPKRSVCIVWHGPIFLLNMRKLWQIKKHNCIHYFLRRVHKSTFNPNFSSIMHVYYQ